MTQLNLGGDVHRVAESSRIPVLKHEIELANKEPWCDSAEL